jgi:demethylmenaquinone methyltransferase / 2-methoxy-6-polyprenyl-1,4-benzoquinol methylase
MAPSPRASTSAFDAHAPEDGYRLQGDEKLAFVTDMFDRVAPTYDLLNWFISLGQTTLWRLMALSFLRPYLRARAKVLDVGCGTGWVSWYFAWRYKDMKLDVEGVDCSPVMLDRARVVVPGGGFTRGDVCALTHDDDAFDVVTTVYTLRNFPNLERGLREMYRVCAPGGVVIILDAFPAKNFAMRCVLYAWLELVMPLVAMLFTRDAKAYRYLSASIRATAAVEEVTEMLYECGAVRVEIAKYTFGAAARLVAHKAA